MTKDLLSQEMVDNLLKGSVNKSSLNKQPIKPKTFKYCSRCQLSTESQGKKCSICKFPYIR